MTLPFSPLAVGIVDQNSIMLAGVILAIGILLLVAGWFGLLPKISLKKSTDGDGTEPDLRLVCSGAGFLLLYLISGWPVLAIFGAVGGWYVPMLRKAKRGRKDAIERVDAIATWVDTIRDNISGAAGLSQALRSSGNNAPEPIRAEVRDLVLRLQHEAVVPSLRRFAADLAHPTADMAVGCLILASTRSAGSLSDILAQTAQSARDSATMMRHVEAGRVHSQSQAKTVAIVSVSMSMLMIVAGGSFVDAYETPTGQVVLFGICCLASVCAVSLYRLGRTTAPKRVFRGVEGGITLPPHHAELQEV